jgi:hypothetical protein
MSQTHKPRRVLTPRIKQPAAPAANRSGAFFLVFFIVLAIVMYWVVDYTSPKTTPRTGEQIRAQRQLEKDDAARVRAIRQEMEELRQRSARGY